MAQITGRIVAAWRAIDVALTPIIGKRAVAALYGRSLHLSSPLHPWLPLPSDAVSTEIDLAALTAALTQQDTVTAAIGGGAVLQAFYDLLSTLVGPALTERLIRSVWENSSIGPIGQDASP